MQCPKCKHDNPSEALFCMKCGTKLERKCPECGSQYPEEALFCMKCGTKLQEAKQEATPKLEDMQRQLQERIPQSLADKLFAGAKQMQGEYRLVTALFADVSGSSTMARNMPLDQYVGTMNNCFKMMVDTISINYEGSINRFIGDCVLAFFGAPITHENDAERAILAALDIRESVKELGLNIAIGINTGMTYVGEMGSDLTYSERSAWGPDVDFAKRLQDGAKAGEIYVGASTYRVTRRAFEFDIPVEIDVKGTEKKGTAYPVLNVRERPEKLRGIEGLRARMIGREREFADLKDAADNLISGKGSIVSIIGEAGLGKSRLVYELREYLRAKGGELRAESKEQGAEGIEQRAKSIENNKEIDSYSSPSALSFTPSALCPTLLEGRSVSIGQTVSYWPFLDILRTYLNFRDTDNEHEMARKLKEAINNLLPGQSEEFLPLLGNLLSIKFGDELDDRLKFASPEQIRYQTQMRLRDFFDALAKKKPLLLILEDLHWADELSLDLISRLLDELGKTPLMLVCVYRPEKEHRVWQLGDQARWKCLDRYTEIRLSPLSTADSRQLVTSLLEIENLPEGVKEVILTKSEGNPFFIEEVIRSLMEQDMIYREDDRWKARDEIANISVPDTIQSVVLARVDRLQSEARYVLQCASVIGRLFRYRLLQHISRQEKELDKHLSEFESKDLVFPERTVPELEYAFKHAFTQEATYEGILQQQRREFHHQVAEGIESLYQERLEEFYEELAQHYSHSGYTEKAVEYLLKAGEKAKNSYANESAISYYQKTMEMLDKIENPSEFLLNCKLELLESLGRVYSWSSKMAESEDVYRKAIELAKVMKVNPRQLARLYHGISLGPLFWQNKFDEVLQYGEMGLMILGDDTKCTEAAVLNAAVSIAYFSKGNKEKFGEYCKRNMDFIKTLPFSTHFMPCYSLISDYLLGKDFESAFEWIKEFERVAKKHNAPNALAESWRGFTFALWSKGDYKGALSFNQKALELFRRIGFVTLLPKCLLARANLLTMSGITDEAEPLCQEAITIAEKVGNISDISAGHAYLGAIYAIRHEWDKAIIQYQKNLELLQEYKRFKSALLYMGKVYMNQGDHVNAIKTFEKAAENILSVIDEDWQLAWVFNALLWIEECYIALRNHQGFLSFRQDFFAKHQETIKKFPPVQCYLEKAILTEGFGKLIFQDDFNSNELNPSWNWINEFNDCTYGFHNVLTICAANGRDLYDINQSAPRLLRKTYGDFAVEVCISPAFNDRPQTGGILIWEDKDNFIRLERGNKSPDEVRIEGYMGGKWRLFGHGLLPDLDSDETCLRLERSGDEFSAYCSADGENWFTCGKIMLPMEDPIQVGIHAIGMIDRTIYCGEYKEGTATLFRNFRIWAR